MNTGPWTVNVDPEPPQSDRVESRETVPTFPRRWWPVAIPARTTTCGRRRWTTAVPEWPGVYAFAVNGRLVYIGSTRNLRSRIRAHVAGWRWRDDIQVKVAVTFLGWETRERRLIERLKPTDNMEWNTARNRKARGYANWRTFGGVQ